MNFEKIEWQGYEGIAFTFEGRKCRLIKPNGAPNGKWALKTEYGDAFPATEVEMLSRGWHIAFQSNITRWATDDDIARKARFIRFVAEEFGLPARVSTVGMSCGGLIATTLAATHPELVDVLYIDAPVLNLLSCPCDLGISESHLFDEFHRVTGLSKIDMLSYRNHPIDKMDILLKNDIPVVLVVGDSDPVVPYVENGAILEKYYKENGGRIRVWVKPGCAHHPHGLTDEEGLVVDAIEAFSKENEEK